MAEEFTASQLDYEIIDPNREINNNAHQDLNSKREESKKEEELISKHNGKTKNKMQKKIKHLEKQKDCMIRLVLHELKKENGSEQAIKSDKKLKDFEHTWVIKYVKHIRHFADNKKTGSKNTQKRKQSNKIKKDQQEKTEEHKAQQSDVKLKECKNKYPQSGATDSSIFATGSTQQESLKYVSEDSQNIEFPKQKKQVSHYQKQAYDLEIQKLMSSNEITNSEIDTPAWTESNQVSESQQSGESDQFQIIQQYENKKYRTPKAEKRNVDDDESYDEQTELDLFSSMSIKPQQNQVSRQTTHDIEQQQERIQDILNQPPIIQNQFQEEMPQMDVEQLQFSEVFGLMIEDAVNEMNDIGVEFGELDLISELSGEKTETMGRSTTFSKQDMESILIASILDSVPDIPDELSGRHSFNQSDYLCKSFQD